MKHKNNQLRLIQFLALFVFFVACSPIEITDVPPFSPTAQFTSQVDASNSLMVSFTSNTTNAKAFSWDFGDGNTSDEANPSHTYADGGEYTVVLTVTGEENSTPAEASRTVNVVEEILDKLEGTLIGHEGSWDGINGLIETAVDGDLSTFVDAPGEFASTGYVGYDFGLGSAAILKAVRFAPRDGFAWRLVNGEIRGSNDPTLTEYDVLFTISSEPANGEHTEVAISTVNSYQYLYYYTSPDGYCNIAEIEFYGEMVAVEILGGSGPITVENSSFENPGTEKKANWDEVPGWNSDSQATDSGVEEGSYVTDGTWGAFKKSSDPVVWNLTNHSIVPGEIYNLTADVSDIWNSPQFVVTLYYDTGDGVRNVLGTDTFDIVAGEVNNIVFNATAPEEALGSRLGIEFSNISSDGSDGWIGFDNIELSIE